MAKINKFICNVKNNQLSFKHFVKYPVSNLILEICNLLLTENLIRGFFIDKDNKKVLIILLRYNMNKIIFSQLFYTFKTSKLKDLKNNSKFINGLGTSIISTSKGLNTSSKSLKLKLGGQKILQLF